MLSIRILDTVGGHWTAIGTTLPTFDMHSQYCIHILWYYLAALENKLCGIEIVVDLDKVQFLFEQHLHTIYILSPANGSKAYTVHAVRCGDKRQLKDMDTLELLEFDDDNVMPSDCPLAHIDAHKSDPIGRGSNGEFYEMACRSRITNYTHRENEGLRATATGTDKLFNMIPILCSRIGVRYWHACRSPVSGMRNLKEVGIIRFETKCCSYICAIWQRQQLNEPNGSLRIAQTHTHTYSQSVVIIWRLTGTNWNATLFFVVLVYAKLARRCSKIN